MRQVIISSILVFGLGFIYTCNHPDDLEAVAGIEGQILFQGTMPDSIKAVALVMLQPEAYSDPDSIGKYLVSYSDPLSQTGEYYIQLKPGLYIGAIVGLLIEPGIFVANIDSILVSADLPVVQLSEGLDSFLIEEEKVQTRDWSVSF